ncbi:MAG: hypothetical protein ACOX19_08110 [Fermentimonas sp.]
MSRLKQNQNIDSLIQGIETVIKSRCSLSDKDLIILSEALNLLKNLKKKKGKTNEQILQTVVEVVVLLSNFFKDSDEMPQ